MGDFFYRPGGGIGRHARLKILCPIGRTGSSPVPGTRSRIGFYLVLLFCFLTFSNASFFNEKVWTNGFIPMVIGTRPGYKKQNRILSCSAFLFFDLL